MAGPEDVVRFAKSNGVPVRLLSDLGSVRTVREAAMRSERPEGEIAVTVLLSVAGEHVLVVVPGDRRVHGGKVGRHLGARPSEVSLASREEVEEVTGCETGTIPPFGHPRPVPLLLDETALEHGTLLYPAGSPEALIEVETAALAQLDGTVVGDWSVDHDPE